MAKNTEKIRQQMHEILDICLDCNGLEARAADKTGAMPTAFFDFAGHIGHLDIQLYPDGWISGGYYKEFEFYTGDAIDPKDIDALRACAQHASAEKKKSEIIERSILAKEEEIKSQEEKIKSQKESLKKLKKSYTKAKKMEEI